MTQSYFQAPQNLQLPLRGFLKPRKREHVGLHRRKLRPDLRANRSPQQQKALATNPASTVKVSYHRSQSSQSSSSGQLANRAGSVPGQPAPADTLSHRPVYSLCGVRRAGELEGCLSRGRRRRGLSKGC